MIIGSKNKKVFCVLFGFCFSIYGASVDQKEIANNRNQSVADQKSADAFNIAKRDLPEYNNINALIQDDNVQDSVRILQTKVLELLRNINENEKIEGTEKDIKQSKEKINSLIYLQTGLEEAKNLGMIERLLKLNKGGRKEVEFARAVIDAVSNATSFDSIRKIPGINEKINPVLDNYETLEQSVLNADTLEKIKKIPGINKVGVGVLEEMNQELNSVKNLDDVNDVENHLVLNQKLKQQVHDLLMQGTDLKNADTVDRLAKIFSVNKKLIATIKSEFAKFEKLKKDYKKLQKDNLDLSAKNTDQANDNEKNRRFSNSLVGVLLRALIGFDYRTQTFDVSKNKDLKVVDKTALIASSKTSFSHLGGKEEDLYLITNEIQSILKILLTDKDWTKQSAVIKKKLAGIKAVSDTLNEDANIIKFNIDYAIDIVDRLANGDKRPSRDNVPNYSAAPVKN